MRWGAKERKSSKGGRERGQGASGFSRLLAARHSAGARRPKARGLRAVSERASERSSSSSKQASKSQSGRGMVGDLPDTVRERVSGTHIIECVG